MKAYSFTYDLFPTPTITTDSPFLLHEVLNSELSLILNT